ncbi:MAG: hypothetical protein JWN78_1457 [Bacteroidota bacterium]|nr:hypothetical protein [Bacteroidota bacterium]
MNTRLVLWGDIGTDRKALVAIYLQEETAKIHIYAFPKETVTKEIQDALFVEWKNGGEYEFPEDAIHWEVDANSDTILPENLKVDRPEIVLQSQHKWSKKLMGSKINQLLADETKLLEEKASTAAEFDQSLWDKAKAQWEKISSYQKKNEISWEQTTVLKEKINGVFDTLKAIKRINNENDDQANSVLVKQFYQRVEELQSKLIYSDQWKYIFEELKKMQQELKEASIRWNHKKALYNGVNTLFDDLRKYRMTEVVSKTKGRISQLSKILDGLKDSIARDHESYNMQVEKMQHYTRGKLPEDEIKSRFSFVFDKIKEKEVKADGIKQTIEQLKKDIEKEKIQQEEREQQKVKREQDAENKKQSRQEETAEKEEIEKNVQNTEQPDKNKSTSVKKRPRKIVIPENEDAQKQEEKPVENSEEEKAEEKTDVETSNVPKVVEREEKPQEETIEAPEDIEEPANKIIKEQEAEEKQTEEAVEVPEAEKILAENNADLEHIVETSAHPVAEENEETENKDDALEEEIAKTTAAAKNNPD